jgi:hypothetical protein
MQERFEEFITYYLKKFNCNAMCGRREALVLTDGNFEHWGYIKECCCTGNSFQNVD